MRKYWLSLISCFLIMSLGHTAFAVDQTETVSTGMQLMSTIVGLLSWGWTILAFLAGKLMSNDWIYATGLHLDKVLYVMRNYMKNIANFVLVGYLISSVLKSVVGKGDFNYKSELGKVLLAGVLINMSWFLMGALIDLSNIGTAAVGAFPQALVNESVISQQGYEKLNVSIPTKVSINMENPNGGSMATYDKDNVSLDKVRGRFNDMSGPLLFIGASIFRLHDFGNVNAQITKVSDFSIALMIKVIVMIMFIAPLAALFVINLKRIFYIWMWVIFAPFIVIFEVLKIGTGGLGKMKDLFSLKEIVGLIMQPIFTIGGMALVLLLSVSMYYVLGGTPGQTPSATPISHVIAGAEISTVSGSSTFTQTQVGSEITFVGDLFSDVADYAGGFIGYLIITTFCIMLMWAVVKMCISGSKIASNTFNGVMKLTESAVGNFNFIPIGGKKLSLGALGNMGNSVDRMTNRIEASAKKQNNQVIDKAFYNSPIGEKIGKAFRFDKHESHELDPVMKNDLEASIKNAHGVKSLATAINQPTLAPLEINEKSHDYLDTVSSAILNNSEAKKAIEKVLGTTITKKDELLDSKSVTGKKFIRFLQEAHEGRVVNDSPLLDDYNTIMDTKYTIKASGK